MFRILLSNFLRKYLYAINTSNCVISITNVNRAYIYNIAIKYASESLINNLAQSGQLNLLKYLYNYYKNISTFNNHWTLNAVSWLNLIMYAARGGHLETVKWLHANRTEGCTVDAMNYAAGNGHIEVVKWLHANRTEGCTVDAMNYAAGNGHIEVVKWLHANRSEGCTADAMDWAPRHRKVVACTPY